MQKKKESYTKLNNYMQETRYKNLLRDILKNMDK